MIYGEQGAYNFGLLRKTQKIPKNPLESWELKTTEFLKARLRNRVQKWF